MMRIGESDCELQGPHPAGHSSLCRAQVESLWLGARSSSPVGNESHLLEMVIPRYMSCQSINLNV